MSIAFWLLRRSGDLRGDVRTARPGSVRDIGLIDFEPALDLYEGARRRRQAPAATGDEAIVETQPRQAPPKIDQARNPALMRCLAANDRYAAGRGL
ncbi:hypothetical protein K9U39_07645 [Rhodoblastus acidophilus]|uniref:Uncharacterized protein n=1 Tax=Candidatus Rhodoblastus alkanivorans TaxID=2954117 RepID=A0ABS9Z752_9HYPH|nr:hypothetical protein [Candidatus Rhodoblastus alkanivorans]MCI4678701.1 hypothetical protein [Candidatus Rhodoblastus alkanivorans]MCI4683503.1 hypothetical protein [Candidatus Rhodoblastus alkanivorans]MDI4640818.1 hypothetical protein [Rhodoblastus acidophilus]